MRRKTRVVLGIPILASAFAAFLPVSSASADPINAPNALSGTADCGAAGTFTFVVNSGQAEATTWSPAFVTAADGSRALFHPLSFDLTFTTPFGTDTEVASKQSAPGPVECTISASPGEGFSLSGTVTGTITERG